MIYADEKREKIKQSLLNLVLSGWQLTDACKHLHIAPFTLRQWRKKDQMYGHKILKAMEKLKENTGGYDDRKTH